MDEQMLGNLDLVSPIVASVEEVARLRNFYAPTDKRLNAKDMLAAKPKALKIRQHSYLTAMDLRRIHYFRYGSEQPSKVPVMTYKEIAQRVKLPASTCFYALQRYERDGLVFVDRRRMNLRKAWPSKTKLKGPIAEYILNHQVLTAWAGFSLVKRVHEISKLGVNVKP
jgi:Winged helix-turn-helix DNA-binding